MSQATNESDNKVMPKDQVSSPSIDESSSGGSMAGGSGGGMVLKKGPWTSAEDAILIDYVKKHGEGNWNAVQKHSGLSRCGKSCRLRWANHLRPNLKKGAFTPEEEQLILELHARMGNKWARMAAHLPGRTDNEIKNYWNTRIKRLQRAGLPLYPPGMSIRASNENEQGQGGLDFSSADKQHAELLQGSNYEIPEFKIHDFGANQGVLPYAPPMPDIPLSSMLSQGLISQNYGFMNPTVNHTKLLRDPETLFPSFHDSITSGLPTFGQFWDEPSEKIHRTFGLGYQDDPDPGSKSPIPFGGAIHGSHASLNGNYSASGPLLGIAKLELPSLQYPETDLCSWPACPSTPPPEPADSYIQSPLATESLQSGCVSPRNSGMLEAVLHQAQTHSIARKQPCEKSLISSVVMPSEMVGSSTLNVCEPDWEEYSDPISPLGRSAASVFNECTPPTSGSSMGELSPPKASSGSEAMVATGESASTRSAGERITPPRQEFLRPDALLGSDWLEESSQIAREHCMLNDAIATLLGEDLCSEYKNAACEMSSTLTEGKELESYPWDNMPGVFHVSEQP